MKKVLIVSYFFPPDSRIACKRYGIMCKYMEQYGYKPYILTTHSKGDLKVPISEENIIRIGKNSNQNIKLTTLQLMMFELFELFKLEFRSIDERSISWYNEVKNKLLDNYPYDKPDIIIGTYGPICNIIVARLLSKKFKVPWVSDLRDLISQYNDDVKIGYRKSKYLDLLIEKYFLSSSVAIITVTNGIKKILKKYYSKKIKVVYNGWENSPDFDLVDRNSNLEYLYYAGSFYNHRLSGLFLLIDALKEINKLENKDIKLIIRSLGPKKFNKVILSYLKKKDMLDKVIIKNPCPSFIANAEQKNARINIVLSDINGSKDYILSALSGKLMELINIDRPILVISSKASEMLDVVKITNKGIVTDSKDEIVDYILNKYLEYRGNKKAIYKFSRKYQTKVLCKFLDKIH